MSHLNIEEAAGEPSGRDRPTDFRNVINLSAQQVYQKDRYFREWEHGPFSHLARLTIPYPSAYHGFKFVANGHLFESLLSVKVYCDSLAGISGSDQDQDPVVADLVTAGKITFRGRRETFTVTPGRICIRDTKASWEFLCTPSTRVRVVRIPRHLVLSHAASPKALSQAYLSDVTVPEVRFLLNFLEAIEKSSGDLGGSTTARSIALDTSAALFAGILSGRPDPQLRDHSNVVLLAAKNVVVRNLDRHDLSPAMVAKMVGVSLRTLHRSFSEPDESLMSFVRRQRLQRAHGELVNLGRQASVSEIAARWHFADASHFIRNFKSLYGTTPAAYLRNLDGKNEAGH
ncbi:helix-turn-helix transcriptional regulator [Streptomyces griseoluteus]|uniref:helix-turn-helix transcriptional regulator n=1 Tax=Streptomyces griseoluteus TaxID=29306 RepID=UPI0038141578